jgi:hypothetical protein
VSGIHDVPIYAPGHGWSSEAGGNYQFATASVWLHIPLTLLLIAIVFRGSALVFRHHDVRGDPIAELVFALIRRLLGA